MAEYVIDLTGVEVRTVATDSDRIAALFGVPLREEVVRCKECGWFEPDGSDHEYRSGWWCKRWGTDMVEPNGFCKWGCHKQ